MVLRARTAASTIEVMMRLITDLLCYCRFIACVSIIANFRQSTIPIPDISIPISVISAFYRYPPVKISHVNFRTAFPAICTILHIKYVIFNNFKTDKHEFSFQKHPSKSNRKTISAIFTTISDISFPDFGGIPRWTCPPVV